MSSWSGQAHAGRCRRCTRKQSAFSRVVLRATDNASTQVPVHERTRDLAISALKSKYIAQTASLLATSFAEYIRMPAYQNFFVREITSYLADHLQMADKCLVLVALRNPSSAHADLCTSEETSADSRPPADLQLEMLEAETPSSSSGSDDSDDSDEPSTSSWTPRNAYSVEHRPEVVATTELSFHESTRSKYLTLNAPRDAIYLCNFAVAPKHRRQGYASWLLLAAEERARERDPCGRIYLHTRIKDEPANALYRKYGYTVVQTDLPFCVLWGQDRRHLMMKELALQ